jgi:fibronectin type 3 domain-containing protein
MLRKITIMGFCILFLTMLIVPCTTYAYETLSWGESEDGVTGYRIYYGTTQGTYPQSKDVGKVLQYSLSNLPLTEGTEYYFIVRAYNDSGESENSNEVSLTIPDSTPPIAPLNVSYNDQSANLEWQTNTEADLKEYRIYSGKVSRNYSPFVSVGKNTSFSTSGLEPGIKYYFAVTAVDNAGNESGYSNEIQAVITQLAASTSVVTEAVTPEAVTPEAEAVTPDPVTPEGHTISWDPVTGDIDGYEIGYSRTEKGPYTYKYVEKVVEYPLGKLYDELSLDANTTYYFVVRSVKKDVEPSGNSNEVQWPKEIKDGTDTTIPDEPITSSGTGSTDSTDKSSIVTDTPSPVEPGEAVTSLVKILTPSNYSVMELKEGDAYYLDREYKLTSVPPELSRGSEEWIKTRNDDKGSESESFLTFTISQQSAVYIGYDSRATGLPKWLSSNYKATGMTVGVSESMDHFTVYRRDFSPGTISIGGNSAIGAENASSNYIVIVQPIVDLLTPSNYSVSQLKEGDAYYLDREYKLTSIPPGLSGGSEGWIKTRNDDKNFESESFLTFTISQQSAVYIGYDSRATGLPNWLSSNYKATGMTVGVSEAMDHFTVYRRDFSPGTISIGGNSAIGAENVSSNYIVIVQPVAQSETADVYDPDDATLPRYTYTQDDDTTPPTITRIRPTSWGYHFTRRKAIYLSGKATDPSGVDKVEWTNSATGISGVAIGKENWKVLGVKLKSGWNEIVITAMDEKGNEAVNKLNVICWSF